MNAEELRRLYEDLGIIDESGERRLGPPAPETRPPHPETRHRLRWDGDRAAVGEWKRPPEWLRWDDRRPVGEWKRPPEWLRWDDRRPVGDE